MKKFLAGVMTVSLAVAMGVGFVACGDNPDNDGVVSDVVTETEWVAAFAQENFVNIKITETHLLDAIDEGVSLKGTGSGTSILAGNKSHEKRSTKYGQGSDSITETYECYYFLEGGVVKTYEKDNDEPWEIWESATENGMIAWFIDGLIEHLIEEFGSAYGQFKYDDKDKGYVYEDFGKDSGENMYQKWTIKFQNGKIASVISYQKFIEGSSSSAYTEEYAFSYGGQSVTIPDITE